MSTGRSLCDSWHPEWRPDQRREHDCNAAWKAEGSRSSPEDARDRQEEPIGGEGKMKAFLLMMALCSIAVVLQAMHIIVFHI